MSKKIELAKKLKALAERGVGGEKTNAEKMLADFIAKHNISMDDIEQDKIDHYFFTVKPEHQTLLHQIVKKVNASLSLYGPLPKDVMKRVKAKGNVFTECTLAEYIEIESMFNLYGSLYDEELDVFYRAFCTANDLLVSPKEGDIKDASELPPDELDKLRRANRMSESIKRQQLLKQLPQK